MIRRIQEHNSGKEKSTKNRIPFELIGYEMYNTQKEARWREYQLKRSAHQRKKFISKFIKNNSGVA
ncbi:MAG: GIY-YIG nuclease family protein, partial [Minisyncoccia bacterium]